MSAEDTIRGVCAGVGVTVPEGWLAYFDVAKGWGSKTDLTSARNDVELAEILFLDAAYLSKAAWAGTSSSLVDIGAGVGAPTIPILLGDASLRATLVEPRRIRTAFLRTCTGATGIADRTEVLEHKIDPDDPEVAGAPFDIALSRATFPPSDWLRIGARLADEIWVLTAGEEPEPAEGFRLDRRIDYQVPSSGAPRTALAFRRV